MNENIEKTIEDTTDKKINNVYQAINAIMKDLPAIGKDSHATYGNEGYDYRSIEEVIKFLKPLMVKHGLFVVPKVISQEREERVEEKTYGNETRTTRTKFSVLQMEYTFYALDGSYVTATVVGEGMDRGDKASNKAMSAAYKYACSQVFSIPTKEIIDPDAEIHGENYPVDEAPPVPPKKFCCEECGKEFTPVRYKGEEWTPERQYKQAQINNSDNVARCADCRKKHEAAMAAEKENQNG